MDLKVKIIKYFTPIVIIVLGGCVNPKIIEKRADITLSHSGPTSCCTFVGELSADKYRKNPRTWTSMQNNVDDSFRELKEEAATRGANFLHMQKSRTQLRALAFHCPD